MRIIIAEGDFRRGEVETGHMADGLVYTAERTLHERGERVFLNSKVRLKE